MNITITYARGANLQALPWISKWIHMYLARTEQDGMPTDEMEDLEITLVPEGHIGVWSGRPILFDVSDAASSCSFTEEFWVQDGELYGTENPDTPLNLTFCPDCGWYAPDGCPNACDSFTAPLLDVDSSDYGRPETGRWIWDKEDLTTLNVKKEDGPDAFRDRAEEAHNEWLMNGGDD